MKTEKEQKEKKPKKKEGRIAKVFRLHQKGLSVKEIAKKMKLSERVVRSYVWRKKNPQAYRALLQRYFIKRKLGKENEAIKLALKNSKKTKKKRET